VLRHERGGDRVGERGRRAADQVGEVSWGGRERAAGDREVGEQVWALTQWVERQAPTVLKAHDAYDAARTKTA
jgi:hypothetical protein